MELTEVVNRIELKIRGIKERLNSLQEENETLIERIEMLSKNLEERETLIKEYEQIDNTNINITTNNIGSEKAKQKIDDLMREIDKCIALLQ
jgi:chromosome segregation ATPase